MKASDELLLDWSRALIGAGLALWLVTVGRRSLRLAWSTGFHAGTAAARVRGRLTTEEVSDAST